MASMKIKLTKKELVRIENFCHRVSKARKDRDSRNKDSGPHRIERELTGKIGEYLAYKYTGLGKVDFSIHKTGECTFAGDLTPTTHVKTCNLKYKGSRCDALAQPMIQDYRRGYGHEIRH